MRATSSSTVVNTPLAPLLLATTTADPVIPLPLVIVVAVVVVAVAEEEEDDLDI
jgi:hypothetical protein